MLSVRRFDRSRALIRRITFVGLLLALGMFQESVQAREAASPNSLKKLSIEELLDVEITSVSKRPERLSAAASAIQVITQEDIRRSGATSLPQALRLASNLEVAQIDSRQWAISARGFANTTANKLLVLIDGRTVYTPLYAGVFWDAQDVLLEDIDRIEVISGPGATLWGANAVNGVINITTKRAGDTQGTLVTALGGDQLRDSGGLRYGGTQSTFQYRVYGKYSDRNHTVLPNGADAEDAWHMAQGGFRLDGELSSRDALTVQGDLYEGRIAQPMFNDISISGSNLIGRWTRTVSETSGIQLQFYADRTHRRIPGTFGEDLATYDADFQHRLSGGAAHDIVWGLSYRVTDDSIENTPVLAFLPAHITRQWFGTFAQDEIALIGDLLHATLGAKLEHNPYTGFEFEPSVRLSWRIGERNTLWSAASRAVRSPSRVDGEFYAPGSPPFTLLRGNPNFRSEKLLAYELGYRVQVHQELSASLSTFYDDYNDLRSMELVNPPAPFPFYLGNGLRARSYGAELAADYAPMPAWHLHAGYTELRNHFQKRLGSTDTALGSGEANDPEHFFSLRSSFEFLDHCELDAMFRHVDRIATQDLPSYGELDLRLAWQPVTNLELAVVGQNLLHAQHAEFGAVTNMFSSTRKEIERSVYGKVSWRF
jgi:iron complex outermembrane receptor protein